MHTNWGTTYFKGDYKPKKIAIKFVIFVEFGTVILLSAI